MMVEIDSVMLLMAHRNKRSETPRGGGKPGELMYSLMSEVLSMASSASILATTCVASCAALTGLVSKETIKEVG